MHHAVVTTYRSGTLAIEVVAGQSHSAAWARIAGREVSAAPAPSCARRALARRRRRTRSVHRRLDHALVS